MGNYRKGTDFKTQRLTIDGILWWTLANLFLITFAIASWAGCYYLFTFPELPSNFKILEKIGRIGKIETFTPLDAPGTSSASSADLYELFYALDDSKIGTFNEMLKRGYITNYDKIPVYRYLKGEFRVLETRALTKEDFISPGVLIKARAYVKSDENDVSSPYPVVIDYVIPTDVKDAQKNFEAGDLMKITKGDHCASIIHVKKEGRTEDPTLRCVVIPLAYNNYISPDKTKIPMSAPSKINVKAPFPIF